MIAELLGRFHPLVVHLPIGLLVGVFLMEVARRYFNQRQLEKAIPFVLGLAVIFSFVSWLTGWMLHKAGEFDENLISWHFWSAVVVTVTALLSYLFLKSQSLQRLYFPTLCASMIALTMTGHYGGSLTHGKSHLTKPLQQTVTSTLTDVNSLQAYGGIIKPILEQKCYSCHNSGKKKGGLDLSTIDGITLGGDNGKVLVNGVADSPLIQRFHLPIDHEEHMPPSGKKQLSSNEIQLLEWWVDQGFDFNILVGELMQDENIKAILQTYESTVSTLDSRGLKHLDLQERNQLAEIGFNVNPMSEKSPFVFVKSTGSQPIDKRALSKLAKYRNHIVELDLSGTSLDDGLLSKLSKFKNLQTLKLQNTGVTSQGIETLKSLNNLVSLNLYNTQVDDAVFDHLSELNSLKSLYLWQTDVTEKGIKIYQETHPLVDVSFGVDDTLFEKLKLVPVSLLADQEIFNDTIRVELTHPLANAQIHYTVDGTIPDSTSALYELPILIDQTCAIKSIAIKAGWEDSELSELVLTKNGHQVERATLSIPPNPQYKARGAITLIDLKKGNVQFTEGNWLGFEGQNVTVTLDLGKSLEVQNAIVSALEDTGSYIFFPKSIEVSTSTNGKSYQSHTKLSIPITQEPLPAELKSFLVNFDPHQARYLKVKLSGVLTNPAWHSAPGAKNWIFIDEVLVN